MKLHSRRSGNWIEAGKQPASHVAGAPGIKRFDFDAVMEAGYSGRMPASSEVWSATVPAPDVTEE